jgi:predicted 3-demethylubiquinone-9 3-methyltransferase (glyoxalase superfamily)
MWHNFLITHHVISCIIVPHLWFDTEAEQAVDFYKNVFPETEIIKKVTLIF